MLDALADAKLRLHRELAGSSSISIEPVEADRWIANSLLQKAIRRGEVDVAQRAAISFLRQGGSAIWRRFMIIAFEDVGVASPDVVALTVAASSDAQWRRAVGAAETIAVHLAGRLSEAPKSRSAEHLITTVRHHPSFAKIRTETARRS